MKTAWVPSVYAVLALLIPGYPALADGWSLNPPARSRTRPASSFAGQGHGRTARPSPWEKFNHDLKELNAGTKKFFADAGAGGQKLLAGADTCTKEFFAGAKEALTWSKPSPKRRSTAHVPWIRPPKDPRDLRKPEMKKKSWLDSLFGREEPKRVKSMSEWVGLPRPDL